MPTKPNKSTNMKHPMGHSLELIMPNNTTDQHHEHLTNDPL